MFFIESPSFIRARDTWEEATQEALWAWHDGKVRVTIEHGGRIVALTAKNGDIVLTGR